MTFLLVTAIAAYIVLVVRPFDSLSESEGSSPQTAWQKSIERLGIEPLFPPQEDFHVGDIWAVVASYRQDAEEQARELNPTVPIVGKGIRIGHIDPRHLGYKAARTPVFPDTKEVEGRLVYEKSRQLASAENTSDLIELSLVSFPGLSITSNHKDQGSIASQLGLSASRDTGETDTIKIPMAETYSVPVATTVPALQRWCDAKSNEGMCTDEYVRSVLAFAVDNKVYDKVGSDFRYQLELRLVTQVYLTRKLTYQRTLNRALEASLKAAGDSADGGSDGNADAAGADQDAPSTGAGRIDARNVAIGFEDITYPRPVVFGFRSVSAIPLIAMASGTK